MNRRQSLHRQSIFSRLRDGAAVRPAIALKIAMLAAALGGTADAHHPNRAVQPVRPRIDVIPPLGNNLPAGYRRTYNRPTYWGGRIAYKIAPSSQEAMSWHQAEHRGDYDCNRGRYVPFYHYLKPWEAIKVGSRPRLPGDQTEGIESIEDNSVDDPPELEPQPIDALVDPLAEEVPMPENQPDKTDQERLDLNDESPDLNEDRLDLMDEPDELSLPQPLDLELNVPRDDQVRSFSDGSIFQYARP